MKAITRRKFMGIVVGGLVGTMFALKSLVGKVKIKQEIIDEEDIHLIKASEIVSDGLKASNIKVETISRMEYNLAHWHHFVYNKAGIIEEMYLDGKKVDSMIIGRDCEILKFRRDQCGVLVEEEFWFKGKYIV